MTRSRLQRPEEFAFAVKIRLGENCRWSVGPDGEGDGVEFGYQGTTVSVQGDIASNNLSACSWVTFTARGFDSTERAEATGQSLEDHLRVASVWSNMPFDVGEDDEVMSRMSKDVQEQMRIRLIDDVHGLVVYERTGDGRGDRR